MIMIITIIITPTHMCAITTSKHTNHNNHNNKNNTNNNVDYTLTNTNSRNLTAQGPLQYKGMRFAVFEESMCQASSVRQDEVSRRAEEYKKASLLGRMPLPPGRQTHEGPSENRSIYIYIYIYIYMHTLCVYTCISLSLSLSLHIYIYIHNV